METLTERQSEIIEAAGKIITNTGISGLTIKNLSKEMEFSEAAIYRHFKSKEEIIISMLEMLAMEMDKRFGKIDSSLPPEERLKLIFASQFEYFKKHSFFVVAVFSDGLLEESQQINQQIYSIMQVKMKHLVPIIIEGQQTAVFTSKISTEELVHIIMGAFRLQMYKWRVSHFELDIDRIGNNLMESLLTIIKK